MEGYIEILKDLKYSLIHRISHAIKRKSLIEDLIPHKLSTPLEIIPIYENLKTVSVITTLSKSDISIILSKKSFVTSDLLIKNIYNRLLPNEKLFYISYTRPKLIEQLICLNEDKNDVEQLLEKFKILFRCSVSDWYFKKHNSISEENIIRFNRNF